MSAADTRPARGTRPTNRRELIIAAASELFFADGYANVGMSDIAEAVAVGPSALYRHFRSKQELLEAVVTDVIETSHRQLEASERDQVPLPRHLATNAILHRHSGVLWRREARRLEPGRRALLQDRVRSYYRNVGSAVAALRPDLSADQSELIAHCALGASASISFHSLTLPDSEFRALLEGICDRVIRAEIPALDRADRTTAPLADRIGSRREHILAAAIELFARDGYSHVTMEDIGAAIGIAGPSIYNHFDKKEDVLLAACSRGAEWLRIDMNRTLAEAQDSADAIRRLIASYRAFAFGNPRLVQLLLTEIVHIPAQQMRATQIDYVLDWVHAVHAAHPDWSPVSARIRVQALMGMFNEVAQTGLPHRFANIDTAVDLVAAAILAG